MRLKAGAEAPEFAVNDISGMELSLARYRGKKLMLSFFRNAACVLCNVQIHKLIAKYPWFKKQGLELIAVFESPAENIRSFVGRQSPSFPIVADPEGDLYKTYGVENSEALVGAALQNSGAGYLKDLIETAASIGYTLTQEPGSNFFRMPADFLIDEHGIIRAAHYTEVLGKHIPEGEIELFLAGAGVGHRG